MCVLKLTRCDVQNWAGRMSQESEFRRAHLYSTGAFTTCLTPITELLIVCLHLLHGPSTSNVPVGAVLSPVVWARNLSIDGTPALPSLLQLTPGTWFCHLNICTASSQWPSLTTIALAQDSTFSYRNVPGVSQQDPLHPPIESLTAWPTTETYPCLASAHLCS